MGFPRIADDEPLLIGESIKLEPLAPHHSEGLARAAEDPQIWHYMAEDASTPDGFREWFKIAIDNAKNGSELIFAVRSRDTGEIAGSSRFAELSVKQLRAVMGGSWFHPKYWGTTVNPECRLIMLKIAFERLGLQRLEIRVDPGNEKNQHFLTAIGAVKEGTLRGHHWNSNGNRVGSVVFSILVEEWETAALRLADRVERARLRARDLANSARPEIIGNAGGAAHVGH